MPKAEAFKRLWHNSKAEWLQIRTDLSMGGRIGASEIGAVMGYDQYKCSAQLFYQKLGIDPWDSENHAMFMGSRREEDVADIWQYYDIDIGQDSVRINVRDERILRSCRRANYIAVSNQWPWLFASLDRHFKDPEHGSSVLEIKTISGFESNKWEAKVPPKYLWQVQEQLAVTQYKYGELFTETNGREHELTPIYPSDAIITGMVEKTREFSARVVEAKRRIADNPKASENILSDLVPPPDGSAAYTDFLKARYQGSRTNFEVKAEASDLVTINEYLRLKDVAERQQERVQVVEQELRVRLKDTEVLDCGKYGKLRWKANKNGVRSFSATGIRKEELKEDLNAAVAVV